MTSRIVAIAGLFAVLLLFRSDADQSDYVSVLTNASHNASQRQRDDVADDLIFDDNVLGNFRLYVGWMTPHENVPSYNDK
jgi:hypothetical protein